MKVLIVDDELELLELYEEFLHERDDIEVVKADNAEEAIRLILNDNFDAVFSDISMPGRFDGNDVLKCCEYKNVPIAIACTADTCSTKFNNVVNKTTFYQDLKKIL